MTAKFYFACSSRFTVRTLSILKIINISPLWYLPLKAQIWHENYYMSETENSLALLFWHSIVLHSTTFPASMSPYICFCRSGWSQLCFSGKILKDFTWKTQLRPPWSTETNVRAHTCRECSTMEYYRMPKQQRKRIFCFGHIIIFMSDLGLERQISQRRDVDYFQNWQSPNGETRWACEIKLGSHQLWLLDCVYVYLRMIFIRHLRIMTLTRRLRIKWWYSVKIIEIYLLTQCKFFSSISIPKQLPILILRIMQTFRSEKRMCVTLS